VSAGFRLRTRAASPPECENRLALLKQLDHFCVVKCLGRLQDATRLYIVFELLGGGDLHHRLRKCGGAMETAQAQFYVAHVSVALEHLHSQRVLFRGVKPENVCIGADGYPKLVDFGLCKQFVGPSSKTRTLCGDPEFVAPEVLLRKAYGVAVDCWALGVLAFELLAGCPPFCGGQPIEIYRLILKGEYSFPTYFDASPKAFIDRLLTKDPKQRPTSASARQSSWLSSVPWAAFEDRSFPAPFVPDPSRKGSFPFYADEASDRTTKMTEVLSPNDASRLEDLFDDRRQTPSR